ncbi:hypothetical protein D1872_318930 [compost metagenome]
MAELGKLLIFTGLLIALIGFILAFSDKIPFNLGKLPGDISYHKGNFSFYFPITTSILLSLIFSLLLYLFGKFFH